MAGISLKNLAKALNNVDTIITPKLVPFLIEHGDDPFPDWVIGRIAEVLRTKPRDRSGSFSGSSAGGCARRQELDFLGMPQQPIDAQLRNIFNDGKWRHLRWQAFLLKAGVLSDIEYSLPWPTMRSMGSVDGIGEVPGDHPQQDWQGKYFGFELKGVSTFQFPKYKENGPLDKHIRQVHRYFLVGGFDLFSIIYEDKTTQAWCEWVIKPDPKLLAESKRELEELNGAIDRKELHPMLPDCRNLRGPEWADCTYGGLSRVCPRAGTWPRVKQ